VQAILWATTTAIRATSSATTSWSFAILRARPRGKHPRDADVDVMREIHEPAPLLRVIRAKCIDCSGGSESEARKCTAIGCALWPYRMASNPFRAPREMTQEQRRLAPPVWPLQGREVGRPQKRAPPSASTEIIKAKTIGTTWPMSSTGPIQNASRKQLLSPAPRRVSRR